MERGLLENFLTSQFWARKLESPAAQDRAVHPSLKSPKLISVLTFKAIISAISLPAPSARPVMSTASRTSVFLDFFVLPADSGGTFDHNVDEVR